MKEFSSLLFKQLEPTNLLSATSPDETDSGMLAEVTIIAKDKG